MIASLNVRYLFLFLCACYVLILPIPKWRAVYYIIYFCLLAVSIVLITRQKKWCYDREMIIFLLFLGVVFIGGIIHFSHFIESRAFHTIRVSLQTFSLFCIFKMVSLNYEEIKKYIAFPLIFSTLIALIVGLYKFYFMPPADFLFIDSTGTFVSRFALFQNPNHSALFAALSLGFVLPFCKDSSQFRYYAFLGVALLIITLIYLGSRMGIGIACMLIFIYFFTQFTLTTYMKLTLIGAILSVCALFFFINIEIMMLKILYTEKEPRIIIFKIGFEYFLHKAHYFFGIGSGAFTHIDFAPYLGQDSKTIFHAHNTLLHTLIENGILGLLCYIGLWFFLIKRAIQKKREEGNSIPLQCFWFVFLAHFLFSLTEATTIYYQGNNWLFMLIAIALGAIKDKNAKNT